jgi:hypothetical protein
MRKKNAGRAASRTHPLRRIHVSVIGQCRLCVVMKQWLAMNVISFEEFHLFLQIVNSGPWYESAARSYCGCVVTAASDAAFTPAPALGSRHVSSVTIVILVKPDSCDEDTTSLIESMSFTSIGTAGSAVEALALTLTPRAAALQRYLQRRARSAPLSGPSFCLAFCLLSSNTRILYRFTHFLCKYCDISKLSRNRCHFFHFCTVLRLWIHCFYTLVLLNSLLRIVWVVKHAWRFSESWVMTAAMARYSVIFASRTYACRRRLKIKIAISRSKYDAYIYGLSLDTIAICLRLLYT